MTPRRISSGRASTSRWAVAPSSSSSMQCTCARITRCGEEAFERALLAIEQDLVLAAEIVVEVARREIRFLGDLAHAGRRQAEATEHARRRAQDAQAPRLVLAHGGARVPSPRP